MKYLETHTKLTFQLSKVIVQWFMNFSSYIKSSAGNDVEMIHASKWDIPFCTEVFPTVQHPVLITVHNPMDASW